MPAGQINKKASDGTPIGTIVYAGFGFFVILGGLMGFFQSGSLMSLVAAGISGLILLFAANMMRSSKTALNGLRLAIVIVFVLFVLMGYRFTQSGKFFPAGLVSVASFLLLVFGIVSTNNM